MKKRIARCIAATFMIVSLLTGSMTAFATDEPHDATLIYGGDNKIVVTPTDLNLFKEGMMPGGESTQRLWLRNDYSTYVNVYVRAESMIGEEIDFPVELQESLLNQLSLKISVKVGDGDDLVRYDGVASGVLTPGGTGDMTAAGEGLLLGRLSSTGAADMTVQIKAPNTLTNEYQNAIAKVKWIFTCDAEKKSGGGGGGGGGRDGGRVVEVTESIPDSGVPLDPGVSSQSQEPIEEIPDEQIPLIDAPGTGPKTGDDHSDALWATALILSGCGIVFLIKLRTRAKK